MRFSVYQSPVFLLFLGASFADLLLLTGASATKDELVVHLKSGSVRGGSQKSIFGLNLEYFLGIPYAAAPVGDLRFSPPQPVQPWEGVRDGTNYGARCPQNEDSFPRNTTVGMLKSFLNKFENAAFLLRSQWPTVKNNPSRSRKRSFLKTFFKPKELKTVALRFGVDREDLRSGAFRKRWYHDDHMSFKHKSKLASLRCRRILASEAASLIKWAPSWIQTRKRLGERQKCVTPSPPTLLKPIWRRTYDRELQNENACTAGYKLAGDCCFSNSQNVQCVFSRGFQS